MKWLRKFAEPRSHRTGRENRLIILGVWVCGLSAIVFLATPDAIFVDQLKSSSPIPFLLAFGMFGGLAVGLAGLVIETIDGL